MVGWPSLPQHSQEHSQRLRMPRSQPGTLEELGAGAVAPAFQRDVSTTTKCQRSDLQGDWKAHWSKFLNYLKISAPSVVAQPDGAATLGF